MIAARIVAAVENPKDVLVVSNRDMAQRRTTTSQWAKPTPLATTRTTMMKREKKARPGIRRPPRTTRPERLENPKCSLLIIHLHDSITTGFAWRYAWTRASKCHFLGKLGCSFSR